MPLESRNTVELRLRAAVESSPAGILMIDADGRIVLVNREVERLFGYSREELLGKPVDMLVPERMRENHPAQRAAFLAAPRVRAMGAGRDLFGLHKDGLEVPVEIGLTPIATDQGMFVLSTIVDITERRRAEERFRFAVESSPNGMLMIDRNGLIVLVNREIERMFGYTREELYGAPIELLVPLRFRDAHPEHRTAFFARPETRSMGAGRDLHGLRKDGSEIPVEIGLNPIRTDDGPFVLGSVVDISARKLAEAEHARLEQQLRQAQKMEAIGTLAGGIAHDFNNILAAIHGYGELARADLPPGSSVRAEIDEVLTASERGRQLVQRILAFSRRQETTRRPIDLAATVLEAIRLLRATLPASIEIRTRFSDDAIRVMADSTSLQQVVMNLANNAAQALAKGGTIDVEIERSYVRDSVARAHAGLREGSYAVLTLRDSGEGMEPAVLERAFEPFFTTKELGRGTGLGLSMVHAIMRDHDGVIELESARGRGTTARCFFPAVEAQSGESASTLPEAPRGDGQRLLYVDDEPSLARLGERSLTRLGYQVTVSNDSVAALEMFRRDPSQFDLVVTDYFMPKLTGLDFARGLSEVRPGIPIVMLTGFIGDLPENALRDAGVKKLVTKPITLRELGQAVHEALAGVKTR